MRRDERDPRRTQPAKAKFLNEFAEDEGRGDRRRNPQPWTIIHILAINLPLQYDTKLFAKVGHPHAQPSDLRSVNIKIIDISCGFQPVPGRPVVV